MSRGGVAGPRSSLKGSEPLLLSPQLKLLGAELRPDWIIPMRLYQRSGQLKERGLGGGVYAVSGAPSG